ncbi:tetratricopeptide repeat protein [Herbidospora sp. RD11066]
MTPVRDNPYVGLRAFENRDRDLFFGRSQESRDLTDLWRSNRLVVLYGPSGIGKSSLLHAGAVPLLYDEKLDVLPVGRASAGGPFPTPSDHNPYTFCLLSSWSPADSPARLADLTVAQFLHNRPKRTDRFGDDVPIFAAIDQFEEVLNSPPPWRIHREAFLRQLGDATKEIPHLRLLVSIREDAIAELLPREPDIAGHSRARVRLSPLSADDALHAVRDPVDATERRFAPHVAETLVRELRTVEVTDKLHQRRLIVLDDVEPWQIQVVCTQLWDRLPPDADEITLDHLRDFGDVQEALTTFCLRMITSVADDFGVPEDVLRKWVYEKFVTEHGTRGMAYEGTNETAGMPNDIPRALEHRRILRGEDRHGSRWYELQHDRLIDPIRRLFDSSPHLDAEETEEPRRPAAPTAADYLAAAETALATGEFVPAERHANDALRATSENPDGNALRVRAEALSLLGNLALYQDDSETALSRFRQAAMVFERLQVPTAVARLLSAVARILIKARDFGSAITELQSAMARHPSQPSLKRDLAEAFWADGQLNSAIALFTSVIAVSPGDAAALAGRGQLRAEKRDYRSALDDLDRATEIRPLLLENPAIRAARAVAFAGLERFADARKEAEIAVATGPNNGPALLAAAEVARLMGDETQMSERARQAIDATDPQLFPHAFMRARDMLYSL